MLELKYLDEPIEIESEERHQKDIIEDSKYMLSQLDLNIKAEFLFQDYLYDPCLDTLANLYMFYFDDIVRSSVYLSKGINADATDGQDAAQEVFLKLSEKILSGEIILERPKHLFFLIRKSVSWGLLKINERAPHNRKLKIDDTKQYYKCPEEVQKDIGKLFNRYQNPNFDGVNDPITLETIEDGNSTPEELHDNQARIFFIRQALSNLSTSEQYLADWCLIDELTLADVSERTGLTSRQIRISVSNIKKKLEEHLKELEE